MIKNHQLGICSGKQSHYFNWKM